jgi:hypothetical protein
VTAPVELEREAATIPGICHIVCSDCYDDPEVDPLIALCGSQEERWDLVDDDAPAQDCMVCVELRKAHAPCPSCGGLM